MSTKPSTSHDKRRKALTSEPSKMRVYGIYAPPPCLQEQRIVEYSTPKGFHQILETIDKIQALTIEYCRERCLEDYLIHANLERPSGRCIGCPVLEAGRYCYLTMYGLIDLKKERREDTLWTTRRLRGGERGR